MSNDTTSSSREERLNEIIAAYLQALQSTRDVRLRALQASADLQSALADLERAIGEPPPQTAEQKLRGGDASTDVVALVTGYHEAAVQAAAVAGATVGLYRLAYILS